MEEMLSPAEFSSLKDASFNYDKAVANRLPDARHRNAFLNMCWTYRKKIIASLTDSADLTAQISRLQADLDSADKEYNELNHKYKDLLAEKTKAKKKLTAVVDGETSEDT